MGNGNSFAIDGSNVKNIPSIDMFRHLTTEYDKLKEAGLSIDEMHIILQKRLENLRKNEENNNSNDKVQFSAKEDESRPALSIKNVNNNNTNLNKNQTKYNKNNELASSLTNNDSNNNKENPVLMPITIDLSNSASSLILLIDDSPVASKIASKVLSKLNFEVVTANSAKLGYEILLSRYDEIILIFLDVVMPNVDGVECLSWIKNNPDVAHIPIYMLSGLEDQLLTDVCMDRGAEGMLLKPLNLDIVKSIIQMHHIDVPHKIGNFNIQSPENALTQRNINKNSNNIPNYNNSNVTSTDITTNSNNISSNGNNTNDNKNNNSNISSNNNSNNNNNSTYNNNNTYTPSKVLKQPSVVTEKTLAPAFKLCDSEFQIYSYPEREAIELQQNTFLIFIPTLYCLEMYEKHGFMRSLFTHYERLTSSGDAIICITGDLPYSLAAAKRQFELPFRLCSDPSLFVAQRYVGTIDIGSILAKPEGGTNTNHSELSSAQDDYSNHAQNSYLAPQLGIVYVNPTRNVLKKWIQGVGTKIEFNKFPKDIFNWCELAVSSMKGNTNIPNSTSTGNHKNKEDLKVSSSTSNIDKSSLKKKHILVVDDSSVSSRVASKKLEQLGYNVTCTYNGQLAYDLLKKSDKNMFSMLLVDVVMPVCDGMELLRLLKADRDIKHIPVIMLTGLDGEELSRNCLFLGANFLMKKPFDEILFDEYVQIIFSAEVVD